MNAISITIRLKYPELAKDAEFMSGCLQGIFRANLDGQMSDELARQVRVIALVCVQAASELEKERWPFSSLHLAAYYGDSEILQILLRIYDYEESKKNVLGLSPAQFAMVKTHLQVLAVLYDHDSSSIYDGNLLREPSPYEWLKKLNASMKDKTGSINESACLTRIYMCGDNETPTLGILPGKRALHPVPVQFFDEEFSFGKEVSQVSFGKYHTIYLIDGRAFSCGLGCYGKLGHGDEKDQLKPREIKYPEPIVSVAAGQYHSIICTNKKVLVFGQNIHGQLGLGTKKAVLTPTEVKFFKEENQFIAGCSTTDKLSAIILNNCDVWVAGTPSGFWQKYASNTFKYMTNPFSYGPTSIHVIDYDMIRIRCSANLSTVVITMEEKNYYVSSTRVIEKCIGTFRTSKFGGALFVGKQHIPNSLDSLAIYIFRTDKPETLDYVYFFDSSTKFDINGIKNVDVSRNGQIAVIDRSGDVFEGNLTEQAFFSDTPYLPGNFIVPYKGRFHQSVDVFLDRIHGILPAKKVILAPNGRNMVLNLLEVDSQRILQHTEMIPKTEISDVSTAVIICVDENNEEMGRFESPVEALKSESEFCLSFFERWTENGENEVRIPAKPEIVEEFLAFCTKHSVSSNLSKQELFDLLIFANKLLCKNFFTAVKAELFKPPLELSTLRDLYALARHLASVELYEDLSKICASMFLMLLECGFISKLSKEEIAGIEDAFQTFIKETEKSESSNGFVKTINGYVRKIVVAEQYVANIIADVLKIIQEPMEIDDLVDLCNDIRSGFYHKGVKKRRKHGSSGHAAGAGNDRNQELKKEPGVQGEGDNCSENTSSVCSKAASDISVIGAESSPQANVQVADTKEEGISEKNFKKLEESKHTSASSSSDVEAGTNNLNGEADISSAGKSKRMWNTPKACPYVSLSDVLAEEQEKADKEKREDGMSRSNTSTSPRKPQQKKTSHSWNLDESVTNESSFAQIMKDEEARQNETMRQTHPRLSDINTEEQAMGEMVEHYETEAAAQNVSVTVSAERQVAEINDPLWAARS